MKATVVCPTQKQLEAMVEKWQKILRLSDWNVSVRYGTEGELDEEAVAQINSNPCSKTAHILIMPLDLYVKGDFRIEEFDVEGSLVHELLHLHFTFVQGMMGAKYKHYVTSLEQAIESIEPALTKLYRSQA